MTEQEWLECTDSETFLYFLRGKATDRKMRLLAVAACRGVWHLLTDERSRQALDIAERFAHGKARKNELVLAETHAAKAVAQAYELWNSVKSIDDDVVPPAGVRYWATEAALHASGSGAPMSFEHAIFDADMALAWYKNEELIAGPSCWGPSIVCSAWNGILRDIFGNPFRPVKLDPGWVTFNVVDLALTIYEEKLFDRMPILSDALMDAGCDHADILAHCKEAGSHVRGCRLIDLILGKE